MNNYHHNNSRNYKIHKIIKKAFSKTDLNHDEITTLFQSRGDDLHFEPLFLYERVLIATKGHDLLGAPMTSLDSISKYPLILMARGTYTRYILEDQLQKRGLNYEVIMELDSMDMIKKFVTIGMGISVGPRLAIEEEDLDHLGMVSLANFLPVDQAGLITLPGKTLSTPANKFISVLRDTFAASEHI